MGDFRSGNARARYPANTRRSANVVLMLVRRRRRWANIETTLDERLVFAAYVYAPGALVVKERISHFTK